MGDTPTRPISMPERKPERQNVERARFGNALGDQMARQPVPHAHLAGDVEKQEEAEQEKQGPAEDAARHRRGRSLLLRRGQAFASTVCMASVSDGEQGDGVAEADPVPLEEIGGDEGRGQTSESKEEIHQVERGGAMGLG